MLRELSVQNLALIEDARVELQPGYCAWTGETGAGKSLLLTALGLVLGGKASADLVRAGKPEARAAAVFDVSEPTLRADVEAILGGPIDDDQLILTRRISAQGRGTAQANDLPVTVGVLQSLGARLVDLHDQHEGRALAGPEHQRDLLDSHAGLAPLKAEFARLRHEHDVLRRRRLELSRRVEERARERALLEFERDELATLEPRSGEPDELTAEAHRLASADQVREAAAAGYSRLYEADGSAQGILESVSRSLVPLALNLPPLAAAAETLDRLADETREVAYSLRDLARTWEDDPERLEEVEARLAHYRRLASRFRCPQEMLATRREETEARLASLDGDDSELAAMDAPLNRAWRALKVAASDLSTARRKAARIFARAAQARMRPLGLATARLEVEVISNALGDDPFAATPPEAGCDRVEILFAANPGEPARPLRKVASGGELSRVTLAIKAVLAGADRVPTLVFDEIDTGVGGRLGGVLGKTLAELAKHHQVICVTHLPQMASYAGAQWAIRKRVERGRTRTTIVHLAENDRVTELAAMLRGDSAAEGTRREARAMLIEARASR